jgi:hypothetical protein
LRLEGRAQFDKLLSKRSPDRRSQQMDDAADARDPDVAAMGAFLEGAKVYILLAICVICRAFAVVLLKSAMEHLETPIFLVFSHQVALVGLLLLLQAQSLAYVPRLSVPQLQSIIPVAVMESLEMILFSSSLNNGSVLFVVTLTSVVSAALIPWASRAVLTGLTGAMAFSLDAKQAVRLLLMPAWRPPHCTCSQSCSMVPQLVAERVRRLHAALARASVAVCGATGAVNSLLATASLPSRVSTRSRVSSSLVFERSGASA